MLKVTDENSYFKSVLRIKFFFNRFWYENPGIFSSEQLVQIKQSSLGRVLCDDGDNITTVTKDVFMIPFKQNPNFVECSSVPKIELSVWTECCQGDKHFFMFRYLSLFVVLKLFLCVFKTISFLNSCKLTSIYSYQSNVYPFK